MSFRRGFSFTLLGAVVPCAHVLSVVGARAALGSGAAELFPGLVLHIAENVRGPFGLWSLGIAIAASAVALVFFVQRSVRLAARSSWPLALTIGGGVTNLGERLLFGRTTDIFVLGGTTALNVPDAAILVGVVFLLLPRRVPGVLTSRPARS